MHFRDRPNVGSDLVDKPDRWPASHFFTEDVSMKWELDRWRSVGLEGLHWWHSTGLCESSISSISFCAQSFWPLKSNENFWQFGMGRPRQAIEKWIASDWWIEQQGVTWWFFRNDGSIGPPWDLPGTSVGPIAGHHWCWLLVLDAADSQAPGPHRDLFAAEITFLTEVWSDRSLKSMSNLWYVESIWICWHLHSDHSVLVPEDTSFVLGMDVWFQAICQSWHGCAPSFLGGTPKNRWMVYFMEKTIYKWMRTGGTLF